MNNTITACNRRIAKYDRQIHNIRMARRALLIALALCAVAICIISVWVHRYTEWNDDRHIAEVVVSHGDTLDGFGYQYKPEWMDVREYREYILDLNNLTSSDLHIGQTLKLYVVGTEYTAEGHCTDNTITTTDGNIWTYSDAPNGCVHITFNDKATPNNIYDDIITDVVLIH